jgi:hypothetical protein
MKNFLNLFGKLFSSEKERVIEDKKERVIIEDKKEAVEVKEECVENQIEQNLYKILDTLRPYVGFKFNTEDRIYEIAYQYQQFSYYDNTICVKVCDLEDEEIGLIKSRYIYYSMYEEYKKFLGHYPEMLSFFAEEQKIMNEELLKITSDRLTLHTDSSVGFSSS